MLYTVIIGGHQVDHLLGRWGYGIVFVVVLLQACGVPVPGTTALIAAAAYAGTTRHLSIATVVVVAAVAATIGYCASFVLGRRGGWVLLRRYGQRIGLTARRLEAGRHLFARHGGKVVFFGRFVTGLRTWSGFLAGAAQMSTSRFLVFNLLGAVAWSLANGLGYYYFGHVVSSAGTPVDVALGVALLATFAASLLYARRQGRSLMMAAERASPEEALER